MPDRSLDLVMQMVQRVLCSQRETREDVREIKSRIGCLESEVANLQRFLAEQSIRLDRFGDCLERVERWLEIGKGQSWVSTKRKGLVRLHGARFPIDAPVRLAGCRAVPDFGAPALGYAEWHPKLTGGPLAGILYQVPVP